MSKEITKNHIVDCFNTLSRRYSIDKITVNMIVQEARVSKSTFYRLFLDKYDVMNYNYKLVLDEIFTKNECKTWGELFACILTFIEKDCKRVKNAFLSQGVNSYAKFVFDYSFNRMNEKFYLKHGCYIGKDEIYSAKLVIYGCVYTVRDWLFDGRPVTKNELAKQIDDTIPEEYQLLF